MKLPQSIYGGSGPVVSDRDTLSVERATKTFAALVVTCGALVALAAPVLEPLPAGGSEVGVLLVALLAMASGPVIWVLPWQRWGRRSTVPLVPVSLAMIALFNSFAREPYLYPVFFLLVFVWIGLYQGRGAGLLFSPLLAVAYLAPLFGRHGLPGNALRSFAVLLPMCVVLAEVVAWVAERLRRAEAEYARSEARYASLVRHASEFVAILDPDGRVRYVSPAVERMLGLEPAQVVSAAGARWVHPDDAGAVWRWFQRTRDDGRARSTRYRVRHADGSWRWIEGTVNNLIDDPAVGGIVVNGRDVTERVEAERALRENEARFRALLESSSDMVSLIAPDGTVLFHYPPGVLGYPEGEPLGKSFLAFVHPDDSERIRRRFLAAHADPGIKPPIECRLRDAAGEWRWFECVGRSCLSDPDVGGFVVNSRDITERRAVESRVEYQALHDGVTGLPNRTHLLRRMDAEVRNRQGSAPALLFFDLDEFKLINDSYGHAEGDRVLQAVAERMRGVVRPPSLLARFGGDEFAVFVSRAASRAEPLELAAAIERAMAPPLRVGNRSYHLSLSIGISLGEDGRSSADELLSDADVAMYAAKGAGRGRTRVFDGELRLEVLRRLDLEQSLRQALDRGELEVHYQPEVELVGRRLRGAEALLRWHHGAHGLLDASEFVGVAEESRLIVPIGDWLLRSVCRTAAAWPTGADGESLRVAINLSACELVEEDLPQRVESALAATGLAADRLCLEITERLLMSDERQAERVLRALKDVGVMLALDDFGTGYSSLTHLRRYPVDRIKIDRSFVDGLGRDHGDSTVVRAVVELGERLGMETVAEGVESEEQHQALLELGCRWAQGLFYGRALDGQGFSGLVDRQPRMLRAVGGKRPA